MTALGLRSRLWLALVVTSLATLAATWLVALPALERRFERERLDELRGLARAVRPELAAAAPGDARLLRRLVERLQDRTGGRIVVFSDTGRPLVDTGASPAGWTPARIRALRAAALRHETRVATEHRSGRGYAATVAGRPDALTLVISKRLDDSRAAAGVLRAGLPLALGAGLGVALVLALLLSRGLSRGLGRLRTDAEALGSEGLEHRVTVGGAGEIAVVAQALEDMRERLVVEQRARADFLSTASHELRTPLASLQATLELLKEELERGVADPETTAQRTDAALRQTRRLTALAGDLLDLGRVDGGVPLRTEPIELRELIETVAQEFAARLGADGRSVRVQGEPTLALADPAAAARIIRILLDNAAKYGAGEVRIAIASDTGQVLVAVEDDGPGVPEDQRERVFQRFVRGPASESASGSGLGLAIGRGLARAMRGELTVRGARFVLTVPAA